MESQTPEPLTTRLFAPIKATFPAVISNFIRSVATAFLTPIQYSFRTGHFRSCFKMAAVSRTGEPIPWYTYPAIDFLRYRDFTGRTILEFGGGQFDTLVGASRSDRRDA